MQSLKSLFKQHQSTDMMIVVILLIYVLVDVKTPDCLAELVDNIFGQIVIILGAMTLFTKCHPLVGVLALFAAYQLIMRSSKATGTYAVEHVMPSEENKHKEMVEQNVIPNTLEEEVVKTMVPLTRDLPSGEQSYQPVLDSNIDSSLL